MSQMASQTQIQAPTILVTGATGTQGGHVIRELLAAARSTHPPSPITIHALVRNASASTSQSLLHLGPGDEDDGSKVTLFAGDFDDVASLQRAAQSCTAVFINVSQSFADPDAERRHAQNILTASLAAGVRQVIYSSVYGASSPLFRNVSANDHSWMGNYKRSKSAIQELVKKPPVPTPPEYTYSILEPTTFLTNFLVPVSKFMYPDLPVIRTAHRPDLNLAYLDPADIGRLVAAILVPAASSALPSSSVALPNPKFTNQTIPIASTHMTMSQVADAMTRALSVSDDHDQTDITVTVSYISAADAEAQKDSNPVLASQLMQNGRSSWNLVDLDQVKSYGVRLGGVDEFFAREKKRLQATVRL